jgi:ABC-2 type transport system ATP-binding protein
MNSSLSRIELEAKDLVVSYGTRQALMATFRLQGSTIGLIGHNGAGKSTLIKTILELLVPQQGTISARLTEGDGRQLIAREDMAFCPEGGSVFEEIKVESYIRFWCRFKTSSENHYKEEGSDIIDALSISPLLGRLGRELSKGERRRVQTAIGFLTKPKLFLFDEPFCGLDIQKTRELRQVLERQNSNTAFIISEHRMSLIEDLSDQVIVLHKGTIASFGTPAEVAQELAKHTYRVRVENNIHTALSELQEALPLGLVSRHANYLHISGDETLANYLIPSVAKLGITEQIEEIAPSLETALHYFLNPTGRGEGAGVEQD